MINVKEIVILEEAATDLLKGKKFYSQKEKRLGDYFRDSLVSDIESLYLFTGIHIEIKSAYRMLSKRFPYAIYYIIEESIVYIIAVLPMRKNPIWINSQLRNRID